MPSFSVDGLLQMAANFGLSGIVLLVWWMDQRSMQRVMDQYRKDMAEQRQMYKDNVNLVKQYGILCDDQRELLIMNTQALTGLKSAVEDNKFCPMVRLEKKASGVER